MKRDKIPIAQIEMNTESFNSPLELKSLVSNLHLKFGSSMPVDPQVLRFVFRGKISHSNFKSFDGISENNFDVNANKLRIHLRVCMCVGGID